RERSQPANRSKLGLLEKHKDYVQRARDFHSKEDRIQRLREKASLRNKDEFYFGMIKSSTKKGVHVQSRGNEPLPTDLVTALKTQDATYIRMQATMEQGVRPLSRLCLSPACRNSCSSPRSASND
ncbi:Utp11 protein-domain-containing protein, partial [Rhodotorula toruloides]